jgi:hypothetical protein
MSPEHVAEMEQLEALAGELADAFRRARADGALRERPEPAFAVRLRAELLGEFPATAAAGTESSPTPVPPARPLDAPDRLFDRRRSTRPFAGPQRRWLLEGLAVEDGAPSDEGLRDEPRARGDIDQDSSAPRHSYGQFGPVPLDDSALDVDEAGNVTALKPSMRWHIPTRVMPSRWIAAGLVASVAVASLAYGSGIMWPVHSVATTDQAMSANLVRGGTTVALAAGSELREGDEIKVGAGGRATLQIGGSFVRMAAGSDVRLGSLDLNAVVVSQLEGRVYYRVSVPAGGQYEVDTATVAWKAHGTAFDLDREATPGGGEQVHGLALFDGIDVDGPQLQATLLEGTSATVTLAPDGSPAGSPIIEPITTLTLDDQWLAANAAVDASLGLPLGQLASLASPTPQPTPTTAPIVVPDQPTDAPTAVPTATATATATSTPVPTRAPTPARTAAPTPRPTPGIASLGALKITRNGDGSYSFSWPTYTGAGFQYYKLVYENWGKTPNFPASPYWACNSAATDNSWSGAIDVGDFAVRLQVVDESSGKAIIRAQTNVVHLAVPAAAATLPPTVNLGALGVTDNGDGTYNFSWTPYTGSSFSYYKLVWETTASGKQPSYPGGSSYWAVPPAGATSAGPIAIASGDYQVRIQAIGYPNGAYAYAQTTILHLVVP